MERVLQQILRLATLLIGVAATSLALAVATVDVTYTGPKAKTDETTIQLFDSTGAQVRPVADNRNRFSVQSGNYSVEVYVGGRMIGSRRQPISLADGTSQLSVDTDTGVVTVLPPGPSTPYAISPVLAPYRFGIFAGPGFVTDKGPTIGVFPATDSPLLKGPTQIYGTSFGASLQLSKDNVPSCSWNFGGLNGHRSTSTQVPVGIQSGWTYHMVASTGATGLESDAGADANLKTDFREMHLNVTLPSTLLKQDGNWKYWLDPMIGIQQSKTTYHGMISNLSIPGIMSTTDQQIRQTDLSGGVGLRAQYGFPNQMWASAGIGLDVDYYWAYYNGMQNNVCAVCSAATQNFDVATHDSANRFTVGASADLAIGYPLGKNSEVFLAGMYRYQRDSATLVNKTAPSDPAPHVGSGNRGIGSVGLGLRIGF